MGFLLGKNLFLEGILARLMYRSLYKMHEVALHGAWKTAMGALARGISRRAVPKVKLH
jgi:NADH:ubiquinone reductase (H+-translocating)